MQLKYLASLFVGLFIFFLDQATKVYIHTQFYLGESVPVIHNFFNITFVKNKGAAFGFLQNANYDLRKTLLLTIPPLVLIAIFYMLKDLKNSQKLPVFFLALVCGGTLGNYMDRLRYDYVIDFLDFYYKSYHFPAFNVADSAIVIGLIGIFIFHKEEKSETPS